MAGETKPRILVKQDMGQHYFFAPCPRGLAPALAEELTGLGAQHCVAADAGVSFDGPFDLIYVTNLYSRIASRVLWRVTHVAYKNEEDVYQAASAVRWHVYFTADRTFKVETNAHRSPVKSLDFVTLRVKDAIADHFRSATGRRPSVESRDPDLRMHAFLDDKMCTLYVDTSGESLFSAGGATTWARRRSRRISRRESCASRGGARARPLLDPMCGAGTFLTEAAEMSLGRAAGRERSFAFEKLARYNEPNWERLLSNAKKSEKSVEALPIFGSDLYGRSLGHAVLNLRDAGLESAVTLKQVNLLELSAPSGHGSIVTNPPYGVRLGEKEQLAEFYPQLGDALKKKFTGWTAYIFSGDPELARLIRLQATRKTVLYNGALECRLYEYRIVRGGNRPEDKRPKLDAKRGAVDKVARAGSRGKRSERTKPVAAQPRFDERFRGLRIGEALHQRGLHAKREPFDDRARLALGGVGVGENGLHGRKSLVDALVGRHRDLVRERGERLRRSRDGAQRIEADHVGAAFPDAVQRRFAIKARERRFLHVAVAAEALHRLDGDRRHALAQPVLRDGREDALQVALVGARRPTRRTPARGETRASVAASVSSARSASTFDISA